MATEIVLTQTRKAFLKEYLLALVALIILFTLIIKEYKINGIILFILGFAVLIGLSKPEITRSRQVCVITPESITIKRGLFSKREHQFHMSSITDVNFEQNVWQRLLNYGNLIIRSFSHAGKKIKVGNVHNPKETMEIIHRLVDRKLDKPSPKPETTSED